MKRILIRLFLLFAFVAVFIVAVGFDIGALFDLKGLLGVVLGSAIIAAGSWYPGMLPAKYAATIGRNAMPVALIITFLFIFEWLSIWTGTENHNQSIAMCCRPILYGLILYTALADNENTPKPKSANSVAVSPDLHSADAREVRLRENGLTEREIEICLLICDYMLPNRKIGERLFISEATVKKHTNNIYRKLSINSREELRDFIVRN